MNKICSLTVTFLLLFPCLLSAKNMAVLETLSPQDLLTTQERLFLTDILRGQAVNILPAEQNWTIMTRENINVMLPPGKSIEDCEGSCLAETGKNIAADYVAQARISQFGKSLAITAEVYETASSKLVASFVGKGETVEDIERIIKEQAPAFFQKARDNAFNASKYDNTPKNEDAIKTNKSATEQESAKADETRQKAEVAYAELDGKKVTAKPTEDSSAQKAAEEATENKAKSFWGGIVAGVIYNDFYSSHFGLNNIKNETGYKHTVDSDEDLLSNFWGIGFKAGFGGLFIASPYFGLHGELGLAFRQGTGKTNLTITLSDKDKAEKKSDLEIEYTASQLNIDIPLLVRVTIPSAFYIEAGPMLSFNVYSKSKSKITDIYDTKNYETKGDLKAFEFDVAAGLGITRNIGKSILDFDLRMVFGMTRISDSKSSPKTWQGQLSVTYWFL